MFSEKLTVFEKHSLNTQQKISTIELMPRRFTSLTDSKYLPELNPALIEKFNKFFDFHQGYTTDPAYEFDKVIEIEYNDDGIIEFQCLYPIRYNTLGPIWNKFLNTVDCQELRDCSDDIQRLTANKKKDQTILTALYYKPDGTCNGVEVHDTHYNQKEYTDNDTFFRLCAFPLARPDIVHGHIRFYPESDDVVYTLEMRPRLAYDKSKGYVEYVERRNYTALMYLDMLSRDDGMHLLTSEQADYIRSICTGNTWYNLEFVLTRDCQIKDINVLLCTHHEFEDLTAS